jgi:hypothetical protein
MRRSSNGDIKTARTTLILPKTVDANLDLYCLALEQSKSEVIRLAVARFLRDEGGLNPDEMPDVQLPKRAVTATR